MKMALDLCGLPPKTHNPSAVMRKQIPIAEHYSKYLTSTPQDGQGHQKRGKSAKRSLRDMTAKCNVLW